MNVVIPPVTRHVALTIRKHSPQINSLEEQVKRGTLSRSAANFLAACVKARLSILVCGPTASGKTSMLNCLAAEIHPLDRVIVIEEIAELRIGVESPLSRHGEVVRDVVTMEARPKNMEGSGEITLGDLVKNSLRQRPNWIVVGEVRGAEAFYMLLGLTSGHAGMCTLHAQNPAEALNRVKMLAGLSLERPDGQILAQMVSSAIKLVVHLKHDIRTDQRLVSSIIEVTGEGHSGKIQSQEIFSLKKMIRVAQNSDHSHSSSLSPKETQQLAWNGVKPFYLEALEEIGLDWNGQIVEEERMAALEVETRSRLKP